MKFLHTADWHLGAKTNGRDRLIEQKRTLDEIESIATYENVDCIIIDYLGLMQTADKNIKGNRVQEITEITRSLKLLAKDLKIPVVVCCQLSRGPEKNGKASNRPMLSDLRDSGSIEQDADMVWFIHRDMTAKEIADSRTKAQKIILDKRVIINGKVIDKVSFDINDNDEIQILESETFEFVGYLHDLIAYMDKENMTEEEFNEAVKAGLSLIEKEENNEEHKHIIK